MAVRASTLNPVGYLIRCGCLKASLKRLHSPDVFDLENHQPEDLHSFSFLLQAMIGPEGKEGEESFDIEVCTPKWIEQTYSLDDAAVGRHHLIVMEYNYARIVRSIEDFIKQCTGADWNGVAEKTG